MTRQYLSNINEKATVSILQNILELNKALLPHRHTDRQGKMARRQGSGSTDGEENWRKNMHKKTTTRPPTRTHLQLQRPRAWRACERRRCRVLELQLSRRDETGSAGRDSTGRQQTCETQTLLVHAVRSDGCQPEDWKQALPVAATTSDGALSVEHTAHTALVFSLWTCSRRIVPLPGDLCQF